MQTAAMFNKTVPEADSDNMRNARNSLPAEPPLIPVIPQTPKKDFQKVLSPPTQRHHAAAPEWSHPSISPRENITGAEKYLLQAASQAPAA